MGVTNVYCFFLPSMLSQRPLLVGARVYREVDLQEQGW